MPPDSHRHDAPIAARGPASVSDLFLAFNRLALQGFGGVLPVAHRELVDRQGWLTQSEFLELVSTAQVLPGPNIVNLAINFGNLHFGWRGALASLAGVLLAPLAIVLLLAALWSRFIEVPVVAGALRGMGGVAAALVFATGLRLLPTLRHTPLGRGAAMGVGSLTLGAVLWLHVPLVWVVLGIGGGSTALAWWRLR